ncbi:unnamed protein product, partial [marine sediment metagenome]
INHIVRNGLIDLQYKARMIARQADGILNRCKEMEAALDKVEEDNPTDNERSVSV